MNSDTAKGKWNQIKGDLKTKWGQLTDDEWTQVDGNKDKLIGKIQEKYGRAKDEVAREVNEFFKRHDEKTQTTTTTGTTTGGQATGTAQQKDPNRKVS